MPKRVIPAGVCTGLDPVAGIHRISNLQLNMVRAGVVRHPCELPVSGYCEIQNPPVRYAVIDQTALLDIFGVNNSAQLRQVGREWIAESLRSVQQIRNSVWSESLAIGSPGFIDAIRGELGMHGIDRESISTESGQVLHETPAAYEAIFMGKIASLRGENRVLVNYKR